MKVNSTNRRTSVSRRLLISFLASTLLPMIAITCSIAYIYNRNYVENEYSHADSSLKLITANIESYLDDINQITLVPYYHSYFKSRIQETPLSVSQINEFGSEMRQLLNFTKYSRRDLGDIMITSDGQLLYTSMYDWTQYPTQPEDLLKYDWYHRTLNSDGSMVIAPGITNEYFYVTRKISNLHVMDQNNVIMMNINTSHLKTLCSQLEFTIPMILFITDAEGNLIFSDQEVAKSFADKDGWKEMTRNLAGYPWTVHILLSTSAIRNKTIGLIMMIFAIYGIGLAIAFLLFHLANRWINTSVEHIRLTLEDIEQGDLSVRCQPLDVREMSQIGDSINSMIVKLDEKIKNEYLMSIEQKSMEFKVLQSQIQPHFLINTIYGFIALNQLGERERLNSVFYSLAHLLRYVLGGEPMATIQEELDFCEDYCTLQKLRFENRFNYHIEIADNLGRHQIPKLFLQPMVENAIIHGIEPCEKPCQLTVAVFSEADILYITIEDNGIGFQEKSQKEKNKKSIGIQNVENRLKLWQETAAINIYRIGNRTIQIIRIPIL